MKVGDKYKITECEYWGSFVGKICTVVKTYESDRQMCTVEVEGKKFLTPTEWLVPIDLPEVPMGQCYHDPIINHPIGNFKFKMCKKCGKDLGDV